MVLCNCKQWIGIRLLMMWLSCREIIKELIVQKVIGITANTGMASLQLGPQSTTLLQWAEIMDGIFSLDKLAELFNNDDKFAEAKKRIYQIQCLIIDETGMLSAKVFNMVEFAVMSKWRTMCLEEYKYVKKTNKKKQYFIKRNLKYLMIRY